MKSKLTGLALAGAAIWLVPSPDVRWWAIVNLTCPDSRGPDAATNETTRLFRRNALVALPALLAALRDPAPRVAHGAATALGDLQQEPAQVIPALNALLNDPATPEAPRRAASKALARFKTTKGPANLSP